MCAGATSGGFTATVLDARGSERRVNLPHEPDGGALIGRSAHIAASDKRVSRRQLTLSLSTAAPSSRSGAASYVVTRHGANASYMGDHPHTAALLERGVPTPVAQNVTTNQTVPVVTLWLGELREHPVRVRLPGAEVADGELAGGGETGGGEAGGDAGREAGRDAGCEMACGEAAVGGEAAVDGDVGGDEPSPMDVECARAKYDGRSVDENQTRAKHGPIAEDLDDDIGIRRHSPLFPICRTPFPPYV